MAEHYRFKFSEAFPADAAVARWLTSLAMAQNDLLHANKRLIAQLEGDAPAYENVSDARLVGAQVWEVVVLMRAGSADADVAAFVDTLPPDAKSEFAEVIAVYDDPARGPFKAALGRPRNHFSHYPPPDAKELAVRWWRWRITRER